jgi:glycine/D-amino acid oxidase-like deaminating enzyme
LYKRLAIMDEDNEGELTYSLPHRECGHVLLGGISEAMLTELFEWEQLWGGMTDFSKAPKYARDAIDGVYERIRQRLPKIAPALPRTLEQGTYWFGARPAHGRVITEWVSPHETWGIPVLHIGGLGGSGFTITPAVISDALQLPRPTDDDQMRQSQIII